MSTIVIKKEKDECDDVKAQRKEGGGVAGEGGGSVVATLGPKAIVEKTQAALKVANEAKQLNLRLKDQKLLMPQKQQPAAQLRKQMGKRVSCTTADQLQADTNDKTELPYKVGSKRFRVQKPAQYIKPTSPSTLQQQQMPSAAPSKCGEIFVTNNARKWTFVCTYCQKTTRDIGEFVCHIKFKHMREQYHENDDDDGDEYVTDDQREELNDSFPDDGYDNHDQDYFDCANYLDVSVHTETDELPNNGVKAANSSMKNPVRQINTRQTTNRQKQNNNYVVDLLDDVDEQINMKTSKNDSQNKNDLFEYDMEEEEEDVEGTEEDNLLFLRSSSIEDAAGDNGNVSGKAASKKYRSHVRGKAYCNLCDKTFQYYSLYRNHMIKHSNITPYKCEYCSKAFKSKQAIRYHMNTHTKEVQYTCPLCPITYGTENQFITHVLNHENETCFPCMVCAKILKSDKDRDEHLATHTEERPFGCNYCSKRFRQKHHLSNHLKLHCQYRCDFCKTEFTSTQTQRRPYACASCEEYPEIRVQVEKQRSKSSNNSEVNPLQTIQDGGGGGSQDADNAECVDLASDDDEDDSETSTSKMGGGASNGRNRVTCQYCTRAYKNSSALNYHMRQKHSHVWRDSQ